MLAFLRLFLNFYLADAPTPTKCEAFWRVALNSYIFFATVLKKIWLRHIAVFCDDIWEVFGKKVI